MVVKATIACGFVECLGQIWKSGEFCDFTVIVEDERIPCHRCVLSACSGFFSGLLKSDMKERTEGCVTISEINKSTLHVILDSVYTGQDGLTTENMIDVWHACHQLQINFMIKECENFVMKNMSTDNYLEIYEHASLLESTRVTEFTHNFMTKNFEHFRNTETFFKLPVDVLRKMVDSQDLVVSSEHLVVESIIEWVSFSSHSVPQSEVSESHLKNNSSSNKDCNYPSNDDSVNEAVDLSTNEEESRCDAANENRRVHVANLLSTSRLYLCSTDFLEKLHNNKVKISCKESSDVIFNALMYNLRPGHRQNFWPLQATPRKCSMTVPVVIFVSYFQKQVEGKETLEGKRRYRNVLGSVNSTSSYRTFANLKAYSLLDDKVFNVAEGGPLNSNTGNLTVFNNVIYYFSSSELHVLKSNCTWERVPNYNDNVSGKLLSHGDYIYLLPNTESLFRIKVSNNVDLNWTECRGFSGQKYITSFVSCGRCILLFSLDSNLEGCSVACYDPEDETTRQLHDIEGPPDKVISFWAEGTFYVLQENGSLWKAVNCDTGQFDLEFVSKLWDFDWPVYGAAFYRGQLYLFGHKIETKNNMNWPTSLPGTFKSIRIMQMVDKSEHYYPLLSPRSWLKK